MQVEVAAWNIQEGFSRDQYQAQVVDGIERLDADVVVLSDSHRDHAIRHEDRLTNRLDAMGYVFRHVIDYQDAVPRPEKQTIPGFEQHLIVLGRLAMDIDTIRLGGRNAAGMHVYDPDGRAMYGIGSHFDDRASAYRKPMAASVIEKTSSETPVFLAGDLNNMPPETRRARLLGSRAFASVAEHAPHPRLQSLLGRMHEMADGEALGDLSAAGFRSSDAFQQPTFRFEYAAGHYTRPMLQLDHIMHTDHIAATDFSVHEVSGSDHLPITATLHLVGSDEA